MQILKFLTNTLRITYALFLLIFGLDKFVNILVTWSAYFNNYFSDSSIQPSVFIKAGGALEVILAVILFIRPILGGRLLMTWLSLIAIALFISGHHAEMAILSIVIAITVFVFTQLLLFIREEEAAEA